MRVPNNFVNDIIAMRVMPKPDIPAYLTPSYSQCYEDIIVESMMLAYSRTHSVQKYVFVEIGANHPVCTSSSFLFKQKYGIPSILVEANPKLIPALNEFRKPDIVIAAAVVDTDAESVEFFVSENNETSSLDNKFVTIRTPGIKESITVPTIRIDKVLERSTEYGNKIILSVDVEAYDLPILKDINWIKYRPLIVIVEPSEDYQPGSIRDIMQFLTEKNYSLISETAVNLIFINNEEFAK